MKNFVHAGSFARRAIELGAPPEISKQAKKVLQSCDKSPTNAVDMDYDAHNPFKVCAESFTPIYKGTPSVRASSLSVFLCCIHTAYSGGVSLLWRPLSAQVQWHGLQHLPSGKGRQRLRRPDTPQITASISIQTVRYGEVSQFHVIVN